MRIRRTGRETLSEDWQPWDLGELLGTSVPERVSACIEGLFVGGSGSSAPSTLALAEWVGGLRAGLAIWGVRTLDLRPRAQEWRRAVLGLGARTRRKEAEVAAIVAASAWLPREWTQSERGAAAEAWCIGRYALRRVGGGT
jgi:hypothetical protein